MYTLLILPGGGQAKEDCVLICVWTCSGKPIPRSHSVPVAARSSLLPHLTQHNLTRPNLPPGNRPLEQKGSSGSPCECFQGACEAWLFWANSHKHPDPHCQQDEVCRCQQLCCEIFRVPNWEGYKVTALREAVIASQGVQS